ncbi:MAG: hypothetical protein Q9213_004152 [Squamulea squamosa]
MSTTPTFLEGKTNTDLGRTDSGRRRRILEQIGGNGSHAQKPLKRLFRLNRSVTTSDLNGETLPRGSMEIASKHSSDGRKYMKIAINPKMYDSYVASNPKMYELQNPSTYKLNFEDLKAKGKPLKWIYRKSAARADLNTDAIGGTGHVSHLSSECSDYGKKVMDEYPHLILGSEICDPATTGTNQISNGYSPSKGIPEPELGIQDFAAATLATAQARTRGSSLGHISKSPERLISQSRQRESPVRKHGNHITRRRTSSKGPYSVPIKFQLRPQRTSLPKTPRTSLDGPTTFKETSPAVNGIAKSSPTKSSPAKSGSSYADEGQSDAESPKIMNAQSAEFIHGQGAYAYHNRSTRKPPKPGPAPTRALPSLPEGHDGTTPTKSSSKTENKTLLNSSDSPPSGCGSSSPKPNLMMPTTTKSPPPKKGHRYRLSPVKNTIPSESRMTLKPSPTFTEAFPQPPQSRSLLPTRESSEAISSPRTQNRAVDVRDVVADVTLHSLSFNDAAAIPRPTITSSDDLKGGADKVESPSLSSSAAEYMTNERAKDADNDSLGVVAWQESRVDRVRALKARDIERHRARQKSVGDKVSSDQMSHAPAEEWDRKPGGTASEAETKHDSQSSSVQDTKNTHVDPLESKPQKENSRSFASAKNDFSPIITVAEQPPAVNNHPIPSPMHNPSTTNSQPYLNPENAQSSHSQLKPNGISHPPSCQDQQHPAYRRPSSPLHPFPVRTSSYSSSLTHPRDNHQNQNRNSHSSFSDSEVVARLEARVAAMEKKNLLLERAFLAVLDASSRFAGFGGGRNSGSGSGYLSGEGGGVGRRGAAGEERERMSAASEVLAPLAGRVDDMLNLMAVQGRGGGGG